MQGVFKISIDFRFIVFVLCILFPFTLLGQETIAERQKKVLSDLEKKLDKHSQVNTLNFKGCTIEYSYYPENGRYGVSNMSDYPGNDRVIPDKNLSNQEKQRIYDNSYYRNSKFFSYKTSTQKQSLILSSFNAETLELELLENKKYVILFFEKSGNVKTEKSPNYFLLDVKDKAKAEEVKIALTESIKACQ